MFIHVLQMVGMPSGIKEKRMMLKNGGYRQTPLFLPF